MPVAELPPPSILPTTTGPTSDSFTISSVRGDHDVGPTPHLDTLMRGFELLTVAAGITLAIQAQVLSSTITITRDEGESTSIRAVNALYISGMIIDAMSAFIAFLTFRWLQCLTLSEKALLEYEIEWQESSKIRLERGIPATFHLPRRLVVDSGSREWLDHRLAISFFAASLFAPMPMLTSGVACMGLGLLIYTWSQHSIGVGVIVTLVFVFTVPFLLAVFLIGRKEERRRRIIARLSIRGDW